MSAKIEYEFDVQLEIEEPKQYNVVLLNDNVSTMEFVVSVLENIFYKSKDEATQIMLEIHNQGKGICGIYPHEIASTKIAQVKYEASKAKFPLKATLEEAI